MPQRIGTQQIKKNVLVAQNSERISAGEETRGTTSTGTAEEPPNPVAEHPPFYFSGVGLLVALVILGFVTFCRSKGLATRQPSRRQTLLEQAVASITHFSRQSIGEGGEKFAPLVGTVFSFILVSNLCGILPLVINHTKEGYASLIPAPTSNLSITLALALIVFVIVQYIGIKENGVIGYFKHFMGPVPFLAPLMFPLEVIGALTKPISLSIRLFGNVFGEETVIAVLVGLVITMLPHWLPIPLQFPMLMFGVFGSIVQAGVFTILTCAYIALAIGDHDDHGHGNEQDDVYDELGAHLPATHKHAVAAH